eukprot:c19283_g1_i2.p1 GENE.c19283_g1_i2~~c19283_g1_i2.p1  ORF type:complete len:207 (+),score=18.72 c19283_g1_i2:22-621(+)
MEHEHLFAYPPINPLESTPLHTPFANGFGNGHHTSMGMGIGMGMGNGYGQHAGFTNSHGFNGIHAHMGNRPSSPPLSSFVHRGASSPEELEWRRRTAVGSTSTRHNATAQMFSSPWGGLAMEPQMPIGKQQAWGVNHIFAHPTPHIPSTPAMHPYSDWSTPSAEVQQILSQIHNLPDKLKSELAYSLRHFLRENDELKL